MKIIWLASYPRSGNTWLRFMLYNYMYGDVRESGDINKLIPGIHNHKVDESREGTTLAKTHFAWSDAHPHFDKTAGFIYILRHPKDVLLSNLNYIELTDKTRLDPEKFATRFIDKFGVPRWIKSGFGNWIEHFASWLQNQTLPHMVIRYESMLDAPHESLKQAVDFLNLEIIEEKIAQAVESSSFETLQKMERREKKSQKSNVMFPGTKDQTDNGVNFMNKGKKGLSLKQINKNLDKLFDERFNEALHLTGYQ
jgi:hypothetical protein